MKIIELGSAIRNHIIDGLGGETPNTSYSRDQLIDEAFIYRDRLIFELSMKGRHELSPFYQTLDAIPIMEADLSTNPIIKSGICRSYIRIPIPSVTYSNVSIEYIGPVSKAKSFKLYFDDRFNHHAFRLRTSKEPYAYVDLDSASDGLIDVMLFNLNKIKDLRYLTVREIISNPLSFQIADCCTLAEEDEFPAPLYVQDMIIDKIVQRYVTQYRQLHIPDFPNKQTDKT